MLLVDVTELPPPSPYPCFAWRARWHGASCPLSLKLYSLRHSMVDVNRNECSYIYIRYIISNRWRQVLVFGRRYACSVPIAYNIVLCKIAVGTARPL